MSMMGTSCRTVEYHPFGCPSVRAWNTWRRLGYGHSRGTDLAGAVLSVARPPELFCHCLYCRLSAKLCLVESSKNATGRQQLIVPPLFRDSLLGHHNNPVGIFGRGQAVRDN